MIEPQLIGEGLAQAGFGAAGLQVQRTSRRRVECRAARVSAGALILALALDSRLSTLAFFGSETTGSTSRSKRAMLTSCVFRRSAISGLSANALTTAWMRVPPVSVDVVVFAEAHALADIDEHGDLRVVDHFARRAAFDAEEEHEQAGKCDQPQQHDADTRGARQLDRIAAIQIPDDADERDDGRGDQGGGQSLVVVTSAAARFRRRRVRRRSCLELRLVPRASACAFVRTRQQLQNANCDCKSKVAEAPLHRNSMRARIHLL